MKQNHKNSHKQRIDRDQDSMGPVLSAHPTQISWPENYDNFF